MTKFHHLFPPSTRQAYLLTWPKIISLWWSIPSFTNKSPQPFEASFQGPFKVSSPLCSFLNLLAVALPESTRSTSLFASYASAGTEWSVPTTFILIISGMFLSQRPTYDEAGPLMAARFGEVRWSAVRVSTEPGANILKNSYLTVLMGLEAQEITNMIIKF